MAPTRKDFVSRIVLSAVVFISLSDGISAGELRRCYWCGPLADQVHRSQRAPPCDGPNTHVTVCDNGYTHCAIVATSPPHVESRYCVKLYQDECYSLYCNSTKTWRMTCPCRGDLCNGPNGEREDQAFVYLAKLVTKQGGRLKRALEPSSENGPNLIPTASSSDINNDTEMVGTKESIKNNTEIESQQTQNMENVPNNTMGDKGMQSDQPATMNLSENTPKPATSDATTQSNKNNVDKLDETTIANIVTEMVKETTEMTTKPTAAVPKGNKKSNKEIKPSEQMPPAEALQHNETPVDKVTEKITMGTTAVINTDSTITTESTMPRNNTASQIDKHLFTLAVGILVLY